MSSFLLFLCIAIIVIVIIVFTYLILSNKSSSPKQSLPRKQMKEYVNFYLMLTFDNCIPNDIKGVYRQALSVIDNLPRADIKKVYNAEKVKYYSLNILQNCALTKVKSQSVQSFLFSDDNIYTLYKAVNDTKLDSGYITPEEHKENEILFINLSTGRPIL